MSSRVSTLALLLASAAFGCGDDRSPNVVLIVVDDLRADHVSSYGYHRETAPFVDELAQQGVLFENAISQSSWTKTSVASILSSLNPDAHGVHRANDVLSHDLVLLPELLQEAGYRTFCVHGNPWMDRQFGFNQGFDYYVYSHWHNEDMSGERVMREAIKWLGSEPEEPFFLYLHFMDVHAPFVAPTGYGVFGDGQEGAYDASILYVDTQLRELHDELGALGVLDDTWFVFTSDHGEEFGEHGDASGHGRTLYREVLDVPLIFYHPRRDLKEKRIARQVRLIDVAPTILDLAGISTPEAMQGGSLRANLEGDPRGAPLLAVSRVGSEGIDLFSFTTPQHKYVLDLGTGVEELYDRSRDPLESENIASRYPDVVERLRRQAQTIRETEQARRGVSETLTEIDEELREALRALGYLQ